MANVVHITDRVQEPSTESSSGLPANLTPELLRAFMALNIQFESQAGLDNVAFLATMGQIASSAPNASGDNPTDSREDAVALTAEFGSISREAATLSAAMNRRRA